MGDVAVNLSHHAWMSYQARVGLIDPLELQQRCAEHIQAGNYTVRRKGFVQIDDVWWVADRRTPGKIGLITCYGRTTMDLPAAVGWAMKKKDRIRLNDMI